MNELSALLKGREIGGFISGLPLQMNGEEGTQAAYTREQAQKSRIIFKSPFIFRTNAFLPPPWNAL